MDSRSWLDSFDRGRGTSGPAACGVVPLPGDQPAMPGQDRGRSDRKNLRPGGGAAAAGTRPPATPDRRGCSGVGAWNFATLCDLHVFVDDSAESITTDDLGAGGVGLGECS